MPDKWIDKTVFTLMGPVTDGMQHNITVNVQDDLPADDIEEYAEWQIRTLEDELKACKILLKEPTQLNNGLKAYRAVFTWWPVDEVRLFQEQIYILHEGTGYTLTASFTKKTRKILGPEIERVMLSFEPRQSSIDT